MKLFHTHKEGYIYILKARRTYILKYVCKMYVCVCVCVCVLYIYNHSPCFQDAQNLEKRTQATVIVSNLTLCLCSCCLPIHPGAWIIFLKSIWLRLLCLNGFPTVAWKISWMEEPGRLQSMGSHRVGHDWSDLAAAAAAAGDQTVKNPPATQETWVWSLGWEDPLEEGMATHSSILAWKIP